MTIAYNTLTEGRHGVFFANKNDEYVGRSLAIHQSRSANITIPGLQAAA